MTGDLVIDVTGITKRYGHRAVVNDIALQVPRGQIFGFLGPNGSGKTTFLRMLCGLLTPDAGSGTCLGYDLRTQSREIKKRVGYMTQRFSFYEDLSLEENLDFVARIYGVVGRRAAVTRSLEGLGLAGRRRQLAGHLSGGWKQRLALAACMIHQPELLLLDEPTAGVDPKARRDFWEEIHQLAARGLTVLITTHYMDEAERCHSLAYIAYGSLLTQGSTQAVVRGAGLTTWEVTGPELPELARALRASDGVEQVVAFGNSLHVSGRDEERLRRAGTLEERPSSLGAGREPTRARVHQPHGNGEGQLRMNPVFSLNRFWAVVVKEFIQMRRDRLTFGMMVGIPLMQLILFGFAINMNPKHLPTAVFCADPGVFARTLVAALRNSDYFAFVREAANEAEIADLLDRGQVQFVVHVPEDFERRLLRGERPSLLLQADASDPTATGYATSALSALIEHVFDRDLPGPLAHLRARPGPVELRIHRHYNPDIITQYNVVPGLLGVVLTMTMIIITALAITRERERGTMENLLSTPARPTEVMLGKLVPYILVGYIQVGLILAMAHWLFQVPMVGSLGLLLLVMLLFITANLAVGITFSTVARNQLQAVQMSFFFFLPSILLSGFMFPFRGMPPWAQVLGEILPLTHFLRIARGILLKGNGLSQIAPEIAALGVFVLVVLTIGVTRYRQTLD
jgi:ABC-2 type transport system permease protein